MIIMEFKRSIGNVNWKPHPAGHDGVEMKVLRSKEDSKVESSIALVKVREGFEVPKHDHEDADDNLYILEGKAKMKVDDEVFNIDEDCQITVPKGTDHEIFDVEKDLLIYDVFSPAIF